ncbi:hypothetical protein BDV95DRAFT_595194 [Massariosphaeria phaeospora]|uniref:PH domain-containing protein n=1 Tax=Massariosphaeria phaeospora TaxID=100035 RepID=A0A7C8I7L6_9PLEO|nr:hypothetical protein BDV95DRAFT_595194 [Massariosphaeria phaeospora]
MEPETSSPQAAPAKISRYRSVRIAQAKQGQAHLQHFAEEHPAAPPVPAMPPAAPMEPQKEATVSRSMSRYHRRPQTSNGPSTKAPPIRSNTVQVPPVPSPAQTSSAARNRATSSPQQPSRAASNAQSRVPNLARSRPDAAPLLEKLEGNREPGQTARDEAKQLMRDEAERQQRMQETLRAEKRFRLEAEQAERDRQERLRSEDEAARSRAEGEEAEEARRQKEEDERGKRLRKAATTKMLQQRDDEQRRARYDQAARKAQTSPPVSPPKHGGAFGGLFRRRKDDAPSSPESPADAAKSRQTSNEKRDLETIRPGGGGAVLGIDAPISASNAGDRRVMVRCNKTNILLPVTPTTTPLDLIKSASNILSETIDVRSAVVLEIFQKVSVRRPLRNYEHVRDVMNSWDDDKQNDLLILDSVSNHIDQQDLIASRVPDTKPPGMGCYIHYSSRPGKWSKRYITLREDGQLVLSKSETSKDLTNICHLSDFDIYSPLDRKLAKVKPPKKICYAVKSQEKSNIFSDETGYVHFFCTNDKNTASLFYTTLQGWRSWWLKHVMGEGQKKTKAPDPNVVDALAPSRSAPAALELSFGTSSHARNESVGSHYQLGSFQPLLDLGHFGQKTQEERKPGLFPDDAPLARFNSRAMHQRKMSTRSKAPPPVSYNLGHTVSNDNVPPSTGDISQAQGSSAEPGSDTFAATGLLGRAYSQRQRALQGREETPSGPFTEGPSLINNMSQPSSNDAGLNRKSSVRSTGHRRISSDLQRSASKRGMPQPLIDLTPTYRAPPQHARKGKAFIPEGDSGPLIENATSLDEAIKIPPSIDWRSRPTTGRPTHGTYGTGGHERTRSLKGRGEGLAAYTVNNHSGAPEDDSNAFTGGGLLARVGYGQGNAKVGHGVMDGSKARGPMLDFRENPTFASGSLLAGVERSQGAGGPVVARDK